MKTLQAELKTVADYLALGEGPPHYQLVEGELFMAPAPNRYHQDVVANLIAILRRFLGENPIGTAYCSPLDVYLDDINVFQPDVVFVSKARFDILKADGAHGAPDLVVEILSPSTTRLDQRKRRIFAEHGTKEFWQIDPNLRQIQRFDFARDTAKPVDLIDEPESFTTPLLPGLVLVGPEIFKTLG